MPTVPAEGTLLQESNGATWVIWGDARFQVPDRATALSLYPSTPIWAGANAALTAFPITPADEAILSDFTTGDFGNARPWVIFGGAKLRMNDPATKAPPFPNSPSYSLSPNASGSATVSTNQSSVRNFSLSWSGSSSSRRTTPPGNTGGKQTHM